jgi:uncharacterized protein YkwD
MRRPGHTNRRCESHSPTLAWKTLRDMWANSPPHFQNMINPHWTKVGIGLYVGDSDRWGTQVFHE